MFKSFFIFRTLTPTGHGQIIMIIFWSAQTKLNSIIFFYSVYLTFHLYTLFVSVFKKRRWQINLWCAETRSHIPQWSKNSVITLVCTYDGGCTCTISSTKVLKNQWFLENISKGTASINCTFLKILAHCVNTKETWIAFEVEHSLHGSVLSSIGLSESSCRIGLVSQYVLVEKK